ncbi:MAG: hypothetical protein KJ626_09040 [Verrucomicrobia bacterium]|nr:hypothetical protein [Verrucomicrobiota bacterium]
MRYLAFILIVLASPRVLAADVWGNFDHADYEEPAGAGAWAELNPSDGVYGITTGSGTWLKGTPVIGEYFLSLYYNDLEEATYAAVGMMLRLMAHDGVAPFIGIGGSYNQSLDNNDENIVDEEALIKGESYWAGHAEAGVRFWFTRTFAEIGGRYSWTTSEIEESEFWTARIGYGWRL